MSKERRRKQFERAVTRLYSGSGESMNLAEIGKGRGLGDLIERMAAGNSAVNVTIRDDPDDFAGLLALQRALKRFGVTVTEVAPNTDDLPHG